MQNFHLALNGLGSWRMSALAAIFLILGLAGCQRPQVSVALPISEGKAEPIKIVDTLSQYKSVPSWESYTTSLERRSLRNVMAGNFENFYKFGNFVRRSVLKMGLKPGGQFMIPIRNYWGSVKHKALAVDGFGNIHISFRHSSVEDAWDEVNTACASISKTCFHIAENNRSVVPTD